MNYFKDCECQETAKEKYRRLAKKLHPDMGGTPLEMAELTRQYEEFKKYGPSSNPQENVYQQQYQKTYNAWDQSFNKTYINPFSRFNPFHGQTGGSNTNPHIQNALNQAQYWKKKFEDVKYQHDSLQKAYNSHVLSKGIAPDERKFLKAQIEDLQNLVKEQKKKATKLRKQIKMLKSKLKT